MYQEGSVIRGRVKRLQPNGAFVEIMAGVDGWLPISQIDFEWVDKVDQILWLGDDVETVITEIDKDRRWIRLSLKERLRQLSRAGVQQKIREYSPQQSVDPTISERTGISAEALKARLYEDEEEGEFADGLSQRLERTLRILLVDDEPSLRIPMAEHLRSLGCQCMTASNGGEACRLAVNDDHDLIFIDIDLPDTDGVSVARQILKHKPEAQIVVITGIALAEDHASELETLNLTGVLMKPLDPTEIRELLETVVRGETTFRLSYISTDQEGLASEVDFFRAISARRELFSSLDITLRESLAEVRKATHAQVAAVFSMDPATRSASLVAQEGQGEIKYDPSEHPLEISPVKDVIIDHEHIHETDISAKAAAKFRYLLPLLDFNSFIGVPVEVWGEINHGLFLFHKHSRAFSLEDFQRALAASIALGATIERAMLDQTVLDFQNLSLQGQLSAGLAHEINNKLSGIIFRVKNLADRCKCLERELADLSLSQAMSDVSEELEEVAELSSTLRQTARLFQVLMKVKSKGLTDVNQAICVAMENLRPMARKSKVELKSQIYSNLPRVPTVGVRLEQAFLNVMLNAIQQISACSPLGGVLEVSTCYQPRDSGLPIKVRFRDDGPGIHRQLFDKIFTLGFTTRPEGSGLGLYITKGLIESIGGRVTVEDSVMLVSTTFLVELPAAQGGGRP